MKISSHFIISCLTGSLLLTACSQGTDTLTTAALPQQTTNTALSPGEQQLLSTLPKLLTGLESISRKIDGLQGQPLSAGTRTGGATVTTPTTANAAESPVQGTAQSVAQPDQTSATPQAPAAPTAPAVPSGPSKAEKAQQELNTMLNKIKSAPFVELSAEKTERNLDTNKVSVNVIKLWQKQPNVVKIDVIKSTSGSTGVKALYTSGQGDKIKVRPAGALSFITTDLPKTDDRLVSNNGYLADDIDLIGVASRFSQGYTPELIGATNLGGTKIHILKLTAQGTNQLDARISHEYIGYDPNTHAIRLWEIYDKAQPQEPYYRMVLNEISFPGSIAESSFKL